MDNSSRHGKRLRMFTCINGICKPKSTYFKINEGKYYFKNAQSVWTHASPGHNTPEGRAVRDKMDGTSYAQKRAFVGGSIPQHKLSKYRSWQECYSSKC